MPLPPVNTALSVPQEAGQENTSTANTMLSANADVFTPTPGIYSSFPSNVQDLTHRVPVRDLLIDSSPDTTPPSSPGGACLTNVQHPGVIGSGGPSNFINPMIYNAGVFTSEAGLSTRAFLIHGFANGPDSARMIGTIFKVSIIRILGLTLTSCRTSHRLSTSTQVL